MLPSPFTGTTIPLLQQVARFTERRQDVLAGNIANLSTPDYRMRDLPTEGFQKALNDAVAGQLHHAAPGDPRWMFQPVSGTGGSSGQETAFPEELFQAQDAEPRGVTFHDGNNRSVEHQVMEMTRNSLLYQAAVELMKVQMNRLQAVISERP